eukprot:GEZU01008523.1.p2 GENE.GEZU01008523.1~~GEZU01008523.1.p2  ORF type:complete len:168 (+),score=73.46 GEZU01008523.1:512-1015(+)
MILKKNFRQVTFLHVYHHGSIFFISWLGMRHAPGGDAYLAAIINSGVHVVMYTYYFCVPLARSMKESKSKNPLFLAARSLINSFLKVKKVITLMQLTQFCIIFTRDIIVLLFEGENFPHSLTMVKIEAGYMVSMVVFFMNFYLHSYIFNKKDKAAAAVASTESKKQK